jgi:DNA-binding MarR family transcriptional regulator
VPVREPLTYQAAADFRAALRRYQKSTEEICRAHGLSSEQYTLLLMVKGSGPDGQERTTVTELATRLQLAHNGVAERVRRAEVAGFLKREPDPEDRRVSWIRMTTRGAERLSATFRALGEESQLLIGTIAEVDRTGRRRRRRGPS